MVRRILKFVQPCPKIKFRVETEPYVREKKLFVTCSNQSGGPVGTKFHIYSENCTEHKYNLRIKCSVLALKLVFHTVSTLSNKYNELRRIWEEMALWAAVE